MQKFSPHFLSGYVLRTIAGALLITMYLSGVVSFPAVHADGGVARFSLKPTSFDPAVPVTKSYFILAASAGTTLKKSVLVTNSGTASGTALLSPVDAITGQSSGTVFQAASMTQSRVGTWISLSVEQVTLAPGHSQTVSFQVVVPRNARAGQHVGGIVAADEAIMPITKTNPVQITVQNLSIIAVQVNLPGPVIEQLSASSIQAGGANGYQSLLVGLSNTGNDMLKPWGSLKVFNAQGRLLQTASLKLDTFLPETSITYPVSIQRQALPPGDYQATLALTYGHGQALSYTTTFTITPQQVTQVFQGSTPLQAPDLLNTEPTWPILLIGLFLLWSAFYLGRKLFRRLTPASKHKG